MRDIANIFPPVCAMHIHFVNGTSGWIGIFNFDEIQLRIFSLLVSSSMSHLRYICWPRGLPCFLLEDLVLPYEETIVIVSMWQIRKLRHILHKPLAWSLTLFKPLNLCNVCLSPLARHPLMMLQQGKCNQRVSCSFWRLNTFLRSICYYSTEHLCSMCRTVWEMFAQ